MTIKGIKAVLKAIDLTGDNSLMDISNSMILRNFLDKTKVRHRTMYAAVSAILSFYMLTTGVLGMVQHFTDLPKRFRAFVGMFAYPVQASVSVPAHNPLNRDILAWLVAEGLGGNPRALTLYDPSGEYDTKESYNGDDGLEQEGDDDADADGVGGKEKQKLRFVPQYGRYTFTFQRRMFCVHRTQPPKPDKISSSDG